MKDGIPKSPSARQHIPSLLESTLESTQNLPAHRPAGQTGHAGVLLAHSRELSAPNPLPRTDGNAAQTSPQSAPPAPAPINLSLVLLAVCPTATVPRSVLDFMRRRVIAALERRRASNT